VTYRTTVDGFNNITYANNINEWGVVDVVKIGGFAWAFYNGVQKVYATVGTASGTPSATNNIGTYRVGDANYGYFEVAEIIIYNTGLGTTDRQAVETYLNNKYSIYSFEWYIIGGLLIGLCFKRKIFYNQFNKAA